MLYTYSCLFLFHLLISKLLEACAKLQHLALIKSILHSVKILCNQLIPNKKLNMISDVLFINHLFRHTTDAIGTIELNKKLILLSIKNHTQQLKTKLMKTNHLHNPLYIVSSVDFEKELKIKVKKKNLKPIKLYLQMIEKLQHVFKNHKLDDFMDCVQLFWQLRWRVRWKQPFH